MSFYSYKNANSCACPGSVSGNVLNGLTEKICIQVKNVYDSCLQQEQLDDRTVTIENIIPVLNEVGCPGSTNSSCSCSCDSNRCACTCPSCGGEVTYQEARENAENATALPQPYGAWTFESCRSSTTAGAISNLSIDRLCDRPQFARIRCTVAIPIDVLFVDQRCQEWMGQGTLYVNRDVLLAIPDESIVPFTLESLVSAICVTGEYTGNCRFKITVCVTVILKILAEVELMVPSYGFCEVPPCEEFAESVCDEFFSLPIFPKANCQCAADETVSNNGVTCGSVAPVSAYAATSANGTVRTSTCSSCGTTCATNSTLCPRCGCTMSTSS